MGKRRVVLIVVTLIWLSLCLEMCYCSKELENAKEKAHSWTDWASHKLAEGLTRIKLDSEKKSSDHQDVIGRAEEAATKATETVNSALSDASKYASDKAGEAVSEAKELGLVKAKNTYSEAKRRINLAKSEASGNSSTTVGSGYDPREMIGPGMDYGRDNTTTRLKGETRDRHRDDHDRDDRDDHDLDGPAPVPAAEASVEESKYNRAQRKLKEAYELINIDRTVVSEKARSDYEAAKENLSRAAGGVGAEIRGNVNGEL